MAQVPLTLETLIRIGVIAHQLWPRLTHNCRIEVLPWDLKTRHFIVHDRNAFNGVQRNEVWLTAYSELQLEAFGGIYDRMVREWYMGASEEVDTLIVMPAEYQ